MTSNNIDWLDSDYFWKTKSGWKYSDKTPQNLIDQFNKFMSQQNNLYLKNKNKTYS